MEIINMCEDIVGFGAAELRRVPHHLHLLCIHASHLVLVVDPCEKERLEAHLAE